MEWLAQVHELGRGRVMIEVKALPNCVLNSHLVGALLEQRRGKRWPNLAWPVAHGVQALTRQHRTAILRTQMSPPTTT